MQKIWKSDDQVPNYNSLFKYVLIDLTEAKKDAKQISQPMAEEQEKGEGRCEKC